MMMPPPSLPRHTRPALLLVLLGLPATHAHAEALYSLKLDNDLFVSGDEHYTNGIELTRIVTPDPTHWAKGLADALPGWSARDLDAVGYHLIHQIYTPEDIETAKVIEDDRPYAGVLLGGLSLFENDRHQGWRDTSVLNLQVGLVGPASGAEEIQKGFHKLIDSEEPEGWRHQLENEPVINLGLHKAWWSQAEWGGLEVEYGPNTSLSLGNLYTYAGAGGAFRFGDGLQTSFGIPSVAPAMGGRQGFISGQRFGWYGFIGVEGRYMAHNLLLDGNTFEDSHSVERREWVGDLQVGFAINWDDWQLAYTAVWRTREFEEQEAGDQFGSITLSTWL